MGRWGRILVMLFVGCAVLAGGVCLLDCCAADQDHGGTPDVCCTGHCACQISAALPAALAPPSRDDLDRLRPRDEPLNLPLFAETILRPPRA